MLSLRPPSSAIAKRREALLVALDPVGEIRPPRRRHEIQRWRCPLCDLDFDDEPGIGIGMGYSIMVGRGCCGKTRGSEDALLLAVGWLSVEGHSYAAQARGEGAAVLLANTSWVSSGGAAASKREYASGGIRTGCNNACIR